MPEPTEPMTDRELLLAQEEAGRDGDFLTTRAIQDELDRRRIDIESLQREPGRKALAKWRAREGR